MTGFIQPGKYPFPMNIIKIFHIEYGILNGIFLYSGFICHLSAAVNQAYEKKAFHR